MTMTTNPSEDSLTVDGHPFTDVELDVKVSGALATLVPVARPWV